MQTLIDTIERGLETHNGHGYRAYFKALKATYDDLEALGLDDVKEALQPQWERMHALNWAFGWDDDLPLS